MIRFMILIRLKILIRLMIVIRLMILSLLSADLKYSQCTSVVKTDFLLECSSEMTIYKHRKLTIEMSLLYVLLS